MIHFTNVGETITPGIVVPILRGMFPKLPLVMITDTLGLEKKQQLEILAKQNNNQEPVDELYEHFYRMHDRELHKCHLHPEAESILQQLKRKGVYVALNSGYNQGTLSKLVEQWKNIHGFEPDLALSAEKIRMFRQSANAHYEALRKFEEERGRGPFHMIDVGSSVTYARASKYAKEAGLPVTTVMLGKGIHEPVESFKNKLRLCTSVRYFKNYNGLRKIYSERGIELKE